MSKSSLPTPLVRHVTKVYRDATPDQLAYGVEWYDRARRLAIELAGSLDETHPYYGDTSRAAAVIAVLSPQLNWERNVILARRAYAFSFEAHSHDTAQSLRAFSAGVNCLPANSAKAWRLLATTTATDEIVSGPKVTAFWHTIADPLDPFAVVVDRHAIDVAVGRVTDDATRNRLLSGKRYEQACDVYRRAAVILSREGMPVSPATVQAVTWTVWRETKIRTRYAAARNREV